jgi:predicted transcriptional regulator
MIAALTSRLQAFIAKNPGKRIEQIGQDLSVSTKELVLSVKKLLAAKAIKTRGQRRATAYFPATAAGRRSAKATTRKRKPKKKATKKKTQARRKRR